MSKRIIDNVTRAALWHVYNHKCFLCNQALEWNSLHIDHIVAEHLADDPTEFKKFLAEYGLDSHFSVQDLKNLIPVHSHCNLRKSGMRLEKKAVLFYLSLTTNKLPALKKEIEKLTKRKNHGLIISKLQAALQSGLVSIEEVEKITISAKIAQWSAREIRLPMGIEFVDQVYDLFYVDRNCNELLDKKILVAGEDEPLELQNYDRDSIMVSTLREYNAATKRGFYPGTTFAIKMSESFTFLADLIEKLEQAQMPKLSFISEPWIDIADLDHLSPNVLHYYEGILDEYIEKGISVGELIRKGVVQQAPGVHYPIALTAGHMTTYLSEQFRADFNRDGIEDIFVRGWARAVGGTLGYGFTCILTKNSETSLIEQITIH